MFEYFKAALIKKIYYIDYQGNWAIDYHIIVFYLCLVLILLSLMVAIYALFMFTIAEQRLEELENLLANNPAPPNQPNNAPAPPHQPNNAPAPPPAAAG